MKKSIMLSVFLIFIVNACTWVELTAEGKAIRVVTLDDIAGCKKTGKVLVRLKDKIAGFDRDGDKVKHELETLARNTVVDLKINGDSIVPVSPIKDGQQTFAVYLCRPPVKKD